MPMPRPDLMLMAALAEVPSRQLEECRFDPGRVVMTATMSNWLEARPTDAALHEVWRSLFRHLRGDWGTLSALDREQNDHALVNGDRLLSSYTVDGRKVWIITEWDRSYTTILFPDDY
jgi:hypothetical protein